MANTMNEGEGPQSYAKNSSHQRGVLDVARALIEEEIAKKLDIKQLNITSGVNTFCIADFGCSTGHNSFPAMQIITEAVEKKLFPAPAGDFQVFFNDQVVNDFNTLFKSLPPERPYHAAGLPGTFHGRLLPKKSLHFAYSACALHWLSEVPPTKDYANHYQYFAKDIHSFLEARADEVVDGGLMAFLLPAVPNNFNINSESADYIYQTEMDLIVSCLMDMANKGRFSQEKVDSFNFPLHFTNPQELKAIIERNQNFNIERMETLNNIPGKRALTSINARTSFWRAVFEGLLINHFGSDEVCIFIDELFDLYSKKVLDASSRFLDPDNDKSIIMFVLLKRKVDPAVIMQ